MTDWLTASPHERYIALVTDFRLNNDWAPYQRACTAEGFCAVCGQPLTGPGPLPGLSIAAGECWRSDCPAAPCRWAITPPYPSGHPGALMYAPMVNAMKIELL